MKTTETNNLPEEHGGYHAFFDFSIDPEETRQHLEQIQDNSAAIGTITRILDFIALMQARPRCETCGEWHDIIAGPGVVGGLHQALSALSLYSDLLAHEAQRGIIEHKEDFPPATP
ncbi:hypothetical protein JWJ90_17060 [Desulfobulbus rhabdoformis]|uniref:hypothetical protein n=1 Tax=Desulfobulbus rhabdoformis TaxID=34032 RepID=UPI001966A61B|nr:hypothetical protein [Desulfobulbus rhabdoformis]MBM9615981.1 hypothetical protein [Desulfobulbus rhabdoformis]